VKAVLSGVLLAVTVLTVFSCASAPTKPLGPGEVRLLRMDFPDPSEVRRNLRYTVDIKYEAQGGPEITRVCIQWTGYTLNCVKALDYGNGLLGADVVAPSAVGSYAVKAYVYYTRDGKMEQSNVVEAPVQVKGEKPPQTQTR